MAIGIDTSFLVAVEYLGHTPVQPSRELLDRFLQSGEVLALNPDVLSEFIHTVTDPKRIVSPLSMSEAIERAEYWWSADEVVAVYPTNLSTRLTLEWLRQFQLGRKRLRDTTLAASYRVAGVNRIVTLNKRDFEVFGVFDLLEP